LHYADLGSFAAKILSVENDREKFTLFVAAVSVIPSIGGK